MTAKDYSTIIKSFHNDLEIVKELVYDKCGFVLTNPILNSESLEYGACSFKLNGKTIQYRVAKVTPTKTGQFVTIWKRNDDGITAPFDILDNIDFIVITTKSGNHLGQFVFPKSVLANNGIISQNGKGGKRGIRVYSPWDTITSKQAEKTQHWQRKYFLTIKHDHTSDFQLAKKLFADTDHY